MVYRVPSNRSHSIELRRLFIVQFDSVSIGVHATKIHHRVHIPELHRALVDFRRLLRGFHDAEQTMEIHSPQLCDRVRYFVFRVPTNSGENLRFRFSQR